MALSLHDIPGQWLDAWDNGMELYLQGLKQSAISIADAPQRLKQNRQFMEEVIKVNPEELRHADRSLWSLPTFMRMAAQRWRGAFELAGRKLKGDKEFVLAAFKCELRDESKRGGVDSDDDDDPDGQEWAPNDMSTERLLELCPFSLRDDPEVCLAAVASGCAQHDNMESISGSFVLRLASNRLRADRSFLKDVFRALNRYGRGYGRPSYGLEYMPEELKNDRSFIWELLPIVGRPLVQHASASVMDDRDFFLKVLHALSPSKGQCCNDSGMVLEHASDDLKGDREIVLMAVKNSRGKALEYATADLQGDRGFLLEAIKQGSAKVLFYTSAEVQGDRDFMLEAAKLSGAALKFAAAEVRADHQVVLEAVRQKGRALMFASDELKGNREIALAAVECPRNFIDGFDNDLYSTGDIAELAELMGLGGRGAMSIVLPYISQALKMDREIVLKAVKGNHTELKYVPAGLLDDRDIMQAAVEGNGMMLSFASERLRGDLALVIIALENSAGRAIQYAAPILLGDRTCIMTACRCLENPDRNYRRKYIGMGIQELYEPLLTYASAELRADPPVVKAAIRICGRSILLTSTELLHNRDNVIAAIRKEKNLLLQLLDGEGINREAITGDPDIMMAALAFRKVYLDRNLMDLVTPALRDGGLKAHVNTLVRKVYNVPDYTFASTFLRHFRGHLPAGVTRLVADFAGVRCGNGWKIIRRAAFHLGVSLFMKHHVTGKRTQVTHDISRKGLLKSLKTGNADRHSRLNSWRGDWAKYPRDSRGYPVLKRLLRDSTTK